MVTQEELIKLREKALKQKALAKLRRRVVAEATRRIIAAHREEYEKYLAEAKK